MSVHERLRPESFAKMWNSCLDADPSGQILTAWIIREEPRNLLQLHARGHGHDRSLIGHRLWRFYTWCADSQLPEAHVIGIVPSKQRPNTTTRRRGCFRG